MQHLLEEYSYLLPSKDSQEPISLFGIECSKGWEDLLTDVFKLITSDYRQAVRNYEYEQKNGKDDLTINILKLKIEDEKSKLPTVCQIKSKFGTLRFYADNLNDYSAGVIDMAERMSANICEFCGNKGKQIGGRWITTLCRDCDKSSCNSGENSVV